MCSRFARLGRIRVTVTVQLAELACLDVAGLAKRNALAELFDAIFDETSVAETIAILLAALANNFFGKWVYLFGGSRGDAGQVGDEGERALAGGVGK